jgi:hypothetical protein
MILSFLPQICNILITICAAKHNYICRYVYDVIWIRALGILNAIKY